MDISILRRACVSILALAATAGTASAATIGINVVLNTDVTPAIVADLNTHGRVRDVLPAIDAVTLQADERELDAIRQLPYVAAANPDARRAGSPIDTVAATDFAGGVSTWNLDAVNVTNRGVAGRTVAFDGTGVYVAVLDTGLLDSWRQYFPQERIATRYAKAFRGGGGYGVVSEATNMWEHDQNSHGTHVTSSILGYSLRGTPVNGVAPKATVIPVKVLGQSGSGWSSVIAHGIVYVADLKAGGALGQAPVVINMSLGGGRLDAVEKAAVDYAIERGVVIVAAASNEGEAGMGYPGAYAPVISAAAAGWKGQWLSGNWWNAGQVAEPTSAGDFYIADFSSREKPGQDLDVAAPGSWVVGPYQVNSGQTSYYYLSGTSMASPHVAGIVALMMQKNSGLTAGDVESILESTAIPMGPGCLTVADPSSPAPVAICWGADATGHGLATADAALAAVQ